MFEEIKRVSKQKESHSIVKVVKLLCLDSDITVPELEEELGIGKGTIYNWDKSLPNTATLVKIALRFKVSADYLLGLE